MFDQASELTTNVRIDRLEEADLPAFRRAFGVTFGHEPRDEDLDRHKLTMEYDRFLAARADTGEIVGTSGAFTYELSLPGGRSAPCGGVTAVSVRADHRRRGLLTRMMGELLQDSVDRGEPLSALFASESPIYGRYGYGAAVPTYGIEIDRRHARLRYDGHVREVRLVSREEALATFPALHESLLRQRGGVVRRTEPWWERLLDDPEHRRDGAGPRLYALLPERGFATYRLKSQWTGTAPDGTVQVDDLVAADADAAAALWRFVLDVDLAIRLRAELRPVDDPILALLEDPQRAKVTRGMGLYLRLVDVEAAVAARGSAADGSLVLDLTDGMLPQNAGPWRLTSEAGEARLERTDDAPDLAMDVEALGSAFLGGTRVTQLRLAGQVAGSHEAATHLDRILAVDLAPTTDIIF
jgi:predicted acetyltransferase